MSTIFRGLPSESYTDNDFWIKEGETVFSDNWMFVCFAHELKSVGDAVTLNIANQPIPIDHPNAQQVRTMTQPSHHHLRKQCRQ